MDKITERKLFHVKQWNSLKKAEGEYMQVYTLGNGSMADEPRKKGFVVYKKHKEGGSGSKWFPNYLQAEEYYHSENL